MKHEALLLRFATVETCVAPIARGFATVLGALSRALIHFVHAPLSPRSQRSRFHRGVSGWLAASASVAFILLAATRAKAEAGSSAASSALDEAERAYQSVDLNAAFEAAERGLHAGGATCKENARLHVLAGTTSALLDRHDASLSHFIPALAIDPRINSEQDISPKYRAPYMEALGYWSSYEDRLSLTAKHDAQGRRLLFNLVDPAQLVRGVKFHVRAAGAPRYDVQAVSRSKRGHIELKPNLLSRGFAFFAEAVDANDNCVAEVGSEDEPVVIGTETKPRPAQLDLDQLGHSRESSAAHSNWLPLTLLTVGAATGAFGIFFNARREEAAQRWNGAECEKPGLSRQEQCGSVDRERSNMQRWAIASYATAGALVTSGAAILLFSSSTASPDRRRIGSTSLGCSLRVEALQCYGTF